MDFDPKWSSSYLSGRSMCTRVDDQVSSVAPIKAGVPQGTVLSPLLFLCYVNNLPAAVSISSYMFANDTALVAPQRRSQPYGSTSLVQSNLNSVEAWSKKWLVKFNAEKSEDVLFTGSRRATVTVPGLVLDGTTIPQATQVKHLGVILSADLQLKGQLRHVAGKVASSVAMLHRLRRRLPAFFVRTISVAVIRPSLEYSSAVWGNVYPSDALLLERIQLQVQLHNLTNCHPSLLPQYLQLPTLTWHRRQRRLELLWKLLHSHGPPELLQQLPSLQRQRLKAAYNLRRPWSLSQLRARTIQEASSWLHQAATDWNILPSAVQSTTTLASFKRICSAALSKNKFTLGVTSF